MDKTIADLQVPFAVSSSSQCASLQEGIAPASLFMSALSNAAPSVLHSALNFIPPEVHSFLTREDFYTQGLAKLGQPRSRASISSSWRARSPGWLVCLWVSWTASSAFLTPSQKSSPALRWAPETQKIVARECLMQLMWIAKCDFMHAGLALPRRCRSCFARATQSSWRLAISLQNRLNASTIVLAGLSRVWAHWQVLCHGEHATVGQQDTTVRCRCHPQLWQGHPGRVFQEGCAWGWHEGSRLGRCCHFLSSAEACSIGKATVCSISG